MRYGFLAVIAAACMLGAGAARAEGDSGPGKTVFNKCIACHSPKAGENKIGPSLFGIVGRPSHSVAGFNYSEPMKAYSVTWDTAVLDHYLIDPRATVPGTKMIFVGIKNEKERADLIAYLQTLK
jgi:cytochrome c